MKKVLMSLAAVAAVFASCQKSELDAPVVNVVKDSFTASVENFEAETKTALSGKHVVWTAGDELAIFQNSTLADKYVLEAGAEDVTNGKFVFAGEPDGAFYAGTEVGCNVAVYPYADDMSLSVREIDGLGATYSVSVEVPATQTYVANSFANGAFPMVAVTNTVADHNLKFKNVFGAVKFQFTGTDVVKSISIEGANNEALAGTAVISTFTDNENPVVQFKSSNSVSKVVLDCGEGVQLGETPTDFYVALPPVSFENGFTVTVKTTDGGVAVIDATAANEVKRSGILVMPKVDVVPVKPAVEFTTVSGMMDVELNVSLQIYEGFYGIFARPEMWETLVMGVSEGWLSFSDALAGMFGTELPCLYYEGPKFSGNLSTFGISEEYLEWDIKNMLSPGSEYVVALVPVLEDKSEYTIEDALVYNVSTSALVMGGKVELPKYTIEKGYSSSSVFLEGSDEVVYVKYEVYDADAEVPTEETCLEDMAWAYDGYYDPVEGCELIVDNSYGVLPGAAYKLAMIVAKADGSASLHVLDVETLAIPFNKDLELSFDDTPEYDATDNSVWAYVNVPAGAVQLYYALNTNASYTEYNASTVIVGILQETAGFNSVDLTEAGVVENGVVELNAPVTSNSWRDSKVAMHVVAVDADGNVSQLVSSQQITAPKKQ